MIAAIGALLLAVVVGSPLTAIWLRHQRDRAVLAEESANRREREAKRALFDARTAQAGASQGSYQPGRRFDGLDAVAEAAALIPELELGDPQVLTLRNHAIACMALADVRCTTSWSIPTPGAPYGPDVFFDATLEHYCCCDAEGNIGIYDVDDNRQIQRLPGFGLFSGVQRFSPGGRRLAANYSHTTDRWFCIWDLERAEPVVKERLEISWGKFRFSSDGRLLVLTQTDGLIRVYDTATGQQVAEMSAETPPAVVCFHPSSDTRSVCAAMGRVVRIYDVDSRKAMRQIRLPADILDVSWHPDGRRLAAACSNLDIYIWDAVENKHVMTLRGHEATVVNVQYNSTGDLLFSTSWDGSTRLWDPTGGTELLQVSGKLRGPHADGRQFASFDVQNGVPTASIWQIAVARECRRFFSPHQTWSVAIGFDGRLLASADQEGIRLWDLTTTREIHIIRAGDARSVWFDAGGRVVSASGSFGVRQWPLTWKANGSLAVGPAHQRREPPESSKPWACCSKDDRFLALVSSSSRAVLRDLDRQTEASFDVNWHIDALALSPDGTWLAVFPGPGIKIWNTVTGELSETLLTDTVGYGRVAFSPDGKWLVSGLKDGYQFWEVETWRRQYRIPLSGNHVIGPIAFTRDGRMAVIAHKRFVARLIETTTGRELATLRAPGPLPDLVTFSFSPNGSHLAAVGQNSVIHVWDLCRVRERLATMDLDWTDR